MQEKTNKKEKLKMGRKIRSEPVKSDETTKLAPWIAVGVSLVSLFFALILQSSDVQQNLPAIPAGSPFWTIASLIMVAISLGSGCVALISWVTGR